MKFLTHNSYKKLSQELSGGHWTDDTIDIRWDYHQKTIEIIKSIGVSNPEKVLEMGTMGIKCVLESQTIDFEEKWDFPGKKPDFVHDCRVTPWPLKNDQFEIFVSLRAFQHLIPNQRNAFLEAFRISKHIIIVVPRDYNNPIIPDSRGIKYEDFVNYLNGIHPNLFFPTDFGDLYYWDKTRPSNFDLQNIFSDFKKGKTKTVLVKKVEYVGVVKILVKLFRKLKKLLS